MKEEEEIFFVLSFQRSEREERGSTVESGEWLGIRGTRVRRRERVVIWVGLSLRHPFVPPFV